MIRDNEQGFLSDKFEDFGSEPIPNGWSGIEKELAKDRRKPIPYGWLALGLLLMLTAGVGIWYKSITRQAHEISLSSAEMTEENRVDQSKEQAGKAIEEKTTGKNTTNQAGSSGTAMAERSQKQSNLSIAKTGAQNIDFKADLQQASHNISRKNHKRVKRVEGIFRSGEANKETSSPPGMAEKAVSWTQSDEPKKEMELGDLSRSAAKAEQSLGAESSNAVGSLEENQNTTVGVISSMFSPEVKISSLALAPDPNPGPLQVVFTEPVPYFRSVDSSGGRNQRFRNLSVWLGAGVGYAQKTISVNQEEALRKVDLQNSFNGSASWLTQIGARFSYSLPGLQWLQAMGGALVGMYQQNLKVVNVDKQPASFQTSTQSDSLSFGATPTWQKLNELRTTETFFITTELGIKPILSKVHQSGPFATVLVWTRISENNASTLTGAQFVGAKSQTAVGYKLGYQHLIANKWQAEVFTTAMPQDLISTARGISVKPQIFGFGLSRRLW